jgi:hypothetical protein
MKVAGGLEAITRRATGDEYGLHGVSWVVSMEGTIAACTRMIYNA